MFRAAPNMLEGQITLWNIKIKILLLKIEVKEKEIHFESHIEVDIFFFISNAE